MSYRAGLIRRQARDRAAQRNTARIKEIKKELGWNLVAIAAFMVNIVLSLLNAVHFVFVVELYPATMDDNTLRSSLWSCGWLIISVVLVTIYATRRSALQQHLLQAQR